jgi:hypothetical protein
LQELQKKVDEEIADQVEGEETIEESRITLQQANS